MAEQQRAEPPWAQQCRQCANLRQQKGGRIWKCMALRVGHSRGWPEMGYCADARAPGGMCGPEGRAYVMGPNVGGEARLAAHQPSQTTTATPQGVASTDQLGGRVRSEKD